MERVYFNDGKHHLHTIVFRIGEYVGQGETEGGAKLLDKLSNGGVHRDSYNGIVDIYYGRLLPAEIKQEVAKFLDEKEIGDLSSYRKFVETHGDLKRKGHYFLHELSDKTVLTLRLIENEEQFVHIHPGRYSPNTFRIKVNTLKTGIFVHFLALCRSCSPENADLINEARSHLQLSPVGDSSTAIDDIIEKLRNVVR